MSSFILICHGISDAESIKSEELYYARLLLLRPVYVCAIARDLGKMGGRRGGGNL